MAICTKIYYFYVPKYLTYYLVSNLDELGLYIVNYFLSLRF